MVFPPQGSGSGSGGGDAFFLGWFTDPAELANAYPTAEEGNYAKVMATGTIWVWNTFLATWVDSHINAYTDGDMLKSIYDIDDDGIVDDASKLGNQFPTYYLAASEVPVAGTGLTDVAHTFNVNVDDDTIGINGSDQLYVKNAVSDAENIGTGDGESYAGTSTDTLQFRTIAAGANVTVTQTTDTITIASTASGSGDVTGPATSIIDNLTVFASNNGKVIADSGISIDDLLTGPPVSTLGNFAVFATTDGSVISDSGYSPLNIPTELSDLTDVYFTGLAADDVLQYDADLAVFVNAQLDYGDVYSPNGGVTSSAITKFSGTSGQYIVGTDIIINSSNNMNLNQHTIYNGVIDGGSLD